MIAFLIGVLLLSSGYQMQEKFDYCEKKEFEGEYCQVQKKLSKYGEK